MRCIFIAEKRGVYTLILETIHSPADVKRLTEKQTELLCLELRQFLVEQVSRTGGHLASNLVYDVLLGRLMARWPAKV